MYKVRVAYVAGQEKKKTRGKEEVIARNSDDRERKQPDQALKTGQFDMQGQDKPSKTVKAIDEISSKKRNI